MVRIRYLIILTAFVSMIAIPILRAQTAPSDTQSSAPVAEQPEESAPEPAQPQAQNPQVAPSETTPQPANPVAEQPEEKTEEALEQRKHKKNNQEAADRSENKKDKREAVKSSAITNAVLWKMPDDIAGKNLLWGQGGQLGQPVAPFTFLAEDRNGTTPKCDVRDANRKRWRVKLGPKSRPAVVASRLLWAVGYFVNDDYVLPKAQISGLKMKRKSDKMHGTQVIDARFVRKTGGQKKIGIWEWKHNPFYGTREFNGLRVMMALINNWDLKDDNNAVYQDDKNNRQIYLASDVGSSFATNGLSWTKARSKGNLESYRSSKFILRNNGTEVDFATPAAPNATLAESFGFAFVRYAQRKGMEWIGKNIPTPDAHWIGSLLGQLTHQQLLDAFRGANFPADEADAYVSIVESRIAELKGL